MKKRRISILFLTFLFLSTITSQAYAVSLFGFDFNTTAFSDDATHISGDLTYWGFSKWGYAVTGIDNIDLDTALNGSDLYTGIEGDTNTQNPYVIEVAFIDNYLFNGPSTDFIVFERGAEEAFGVSVFDAVTNDWTSTLYYHPTHIGDLLDSVGISAGVNAAEINFSSWNLFADQMVTRIRLYEARNISGSADIAAIGGLNSKSIARNEIPEPATFMLLGLGLALGVLKRKSSC